MSTETTSRLSDAAAGRLAEIEELSNQNRANPDPERERQIMRLRHLAGIPLVREAPAGPGYAEPSYDALPGDTNPPEVGPDELSPGLLRAAILRHGCLLVRGLIERDLALDLAGEIEAAFVAREASEAGTPAADAHYDELAIEPEFGSPGREWVKLGGGLLAADSPRATFRILEALERTGFAEIVHGYLGERSVLAVEKTTLRRAEPQIAGGWHQDGSFLGEVRPLNLWLSLSRCGDVAPGLDILPKRLDGVLPAGGEGTNFPIEVHPSDIEKAADGVEIVRPIFEPGDALLFDQIFLHKTGSDPDMPNSRYALESWFFAASAFAPKYAPLAV
jgi:hypothetical protein